MWPFGRKLVQRLQVHPGEIVVMSFTKPLSERARWALADDWQRRYPEVELLILDQGGTLTLRVLAKSWHAGRAPT